MCEYRQGSYVTTVVVHKSYFKNICRSMQGTYTGTQASQINEYVEGFTLYILTACVCTCVCTTAHEGSCFHTNTRVHGGRASGRIDEGPYSLFMLYTPHHTCNTHNIYIASHYIAWIPNNTRTLRHTKRQPPMHQMRLDYTTHQHEPSFPVCYDHFSIQEASLFLNHPLHFGKHCLPYIFPLCTPSEYHQHPPKARKHNHSPTYPGLPCNRQSDKAITPRT